MLVVDAAAGHGGQVPEEHVLGDREIGEQAWVLVNCSNSVPGSVGGMVERCRAAIDQHVAAVRVMDSTQNLDARALAGTVLAQQRQHTPRRQVERHIVQCDLATEHLADIAQSHRLTRDIVRSSARRLITDRPRWHWTPCVPIQLWYVTTGCARGDTDNAESLLLHGISRSELASQSVAQQLRFSTFCVEGGHRVATMADVARLAQVSKTTVSHVLNGTRSVHPKTEQAVREAMEMLAYTPNTIARSLARSITNSVGVAISAISNFYFGEIVQAIEAECTVTRIHDAGSRHPR